MLTAQDQTCAASLGQSWLAAAYPANVAKSREPMQCKNFGFRTNLRSHSIFRKPGLGYGILGELSDLVDGGVALGADPSEMAE
jgi:hypothetical protein